MVTLDLVGTAEAALLGVGRDAFCERRLRHRTGPRPADRTRALPKKRAPPTYGSLEAIDEHTCLLRTGCDWLGGLAVGAMIGVDFPKWSGRGSSSECVRVMADRLLHAAP